MSVDKAAIYCFIHSYIHFVQALLHLCNNKYKLSVEVMRCITKSSSLINCCNYCNYCVKVQCDVLQH